MVMGMVVAGKGAGASVVERIVEDGGICRRFVGESYVYGTIDGEAFDVDGIV